MTVSSLCLGAAVPPTTALRWIRVLEDRELVVRERAAKDGRKVYVCLAPGVPDTMEAYFRAANAHSDTII